MPTFSYLIAHGGVLCTGNSPIGRAGANHRILGMANVFLGLSNTPFNTGMMVGVERPSSRKHP